MVHSQKKLYLVFEYLNQDLKKYMDSPQTGELPLSVVKVQCGRSTNRQGREPGSLLPSAGQSQH